MLDRLISGAGAVTDGADRSVRLLTSSSRGELPRDQARVRWSSSLVLLALAGLLLVAGLEATRRDDAAIARPRRRGGRCGETRANGPTRRWTGRF